MGIWETILLSLWSKLQLSRVHTAVRMADDEAKRKEELNNQLKEYISEWRKMSSQSSRRSRPRGRRSDLSRRRSLTRPRERKKRLEEAEAKRQEMLEAQKAQKAEMADKKKST